MNLLTRRLGLVLGPAVLIFMIAAPPPEPLTDLGMARLGLLAMAVIWWVTLPVSIAVSTITVLALGVMVGALSLDEAFAPANNWVIWFVIGVFGIGAALEMTGLNRRFALAMLGSRWTGGHPYRFMFMFVLSATILSALLSNTLVTVMWLSLGSAIYAALGIGKGHRFAELNSLGIAWGSNAGGAATPIGNPGNAVGIAMIAAGTGTTVSFLQWTMIGAPLALLLAINLFISLRLFARVDPALFSQGGVMSAISEERARLGPMTTPERRVMAWIGVALVLWIIPDATRVVGLTEISAFLSAHIGLMVPALLIPAAMCMTPSGVATRPRLLEWADWAKTIDWGMIIFISGILALGASVGADATGVPDFLKARLEPSLVGLSEYAFVFVLVAGLLIVTSCISNFVSLVIFLPVALTLSGSVGIASPVAVGMVLAMGSGLAQLLPSGTVSNAIVAGSGYVRVDTMIRLGILPTFLHTCVLTFIGYPLARLVLG